MTVSACPTILAAPSRAWAPASCRRWPRKWARRSPSPRQIRALPFPSRIISFRSWWTRTPAWPWRGAPFESPGLEKRASDHLGRPHRPGRRGRRAFRLAGIALLARPGRQHGSDAAGVSALSRGLLAVGGGGRGAGGPGLLFRRPAHRRALARTRDADPAIRGVCS